MKVDFQTETVSHTFETHFLQSLWVLKHVHNIRQIVNEVFFSPEDSTKYMRFWLVAFETQLLIIPKIVVNSLALALPTVAGGV